VCSSDLFEVRRGFDPEHPVVRAIVPEGVIMRLTDYADCSPWFPLRVGGDIHVQQWQDN
jgi:hypothetical protein